MNKATTAKRAAIIRCLVEGNSIRSTSRIVGCSKNTVTKLVVELGAICEEYQDEIMRNLDCKRLQVDEIWSFVGCKEKNLKDEEKGQFGRGDVWTWVAIDADSKLIPTWLIGDRGPDSAHMFIKDLASRLSSKVQLTSDGLKLYLTAIPAAFDQIDYAQLIKKYADTAEGQKRYSPAACTGTEKNIVKGDPDPDHISTSFIERQNLTMRMSMRRFTRLTNGFSKKALSHAAAIAIHYAYYNLCRAHRTLKTTPAVAAGIADHVWSIEELVGLLEARERGKMKKHQGR